MCTEIRVKVEFFVSQGCIDNFMRTTYGIQVWVGEKNKKKRQKFWFSLLERVSFSPIVMSVGGLACRVYLWSNNGFEFGFQLQNCRNGSIFLYVLHQAIEKFQLSMET